MSKTFRATLWILLYAFPCIYPSVIDDIKLKLTQEAQALTASGVPSDVQDTLNDALDKLGAASSSELNFATLKNQQLYSKPDDANAALTKLLGDIDDIEEPKKKETTIIENYKTILLGLQSLRKELRYRSLFDPEDKGDPIANFFILMAKAKEVLAIESKETEKQNKQKEIDLGIKTEIYQLAQDLIVERAAGAAQLMQAGRKPREFKDILANMKLLFVDKLFDKEKLN
jgi:hypothetical protein